MTEPRRLKTAKEEYGTVIFFPGETYEGHEVPEAGTGKGFVLFRMAFLLDRKIDLEKLRALLGDGTSKLTGCWAGYMAELERLLSKNLGENKPLQHIVCMKYDTEK